MSSSIGRFESVVLFGFLLLIPLLGIAGSFLYVSRRVNAVAHGSEWEAKVNDGFPAALEILSNLDWTKSIADVSKSRVTYVLYGIIKISTYGVFIFLGLDVFGGLFLDGLGLSPLSAAVLWVLASLLIVLIVFGRDILRRYREIQALNLLLRELRSFSIEFERAEFQQ